FRVSDVVFDSPVLVFPNETITWTVSSIDKLSLDVFSDVIKADLAIDILLIGCGKDIALIPPVLRDEIKAVGIKIEPMATGAACRTFNVLTTEDRRVAAALIPVE
ncbi:MAG: Mth938-like domain-containing protein, partial [Rhodospirillales bacterium]|nr:Mth938-like domain-containing protein [Rhodospirillales bacterium]